MIPKDYPEEFEEDFIGLGNNYRCKVLQPETRVQDILLEQSRADFWSFVIAMPAVVILLLMMINP